MTRLTVGKLKKILKDLPDDMEIHGNYPYKSDEDFTMDGYDYVRQVFVGKIYSSSLKEQQLLFMVLGDPEYYSTIQKDDKMLWDWDDDKYPFEEINND